MGGHMKQCKKFKLTGRKLIRHLEKVQESHPIKLMWTGHAKKNVTGAIWLYQQNKMMQDFGPKIADNWREILCGGFHVWPGVGGGGTGTFNPLTSCDKEHR